YYVGTTVGLYSTTKINGSQTIWTQEAPSIIGNLIVESLDARQSDERMIVSTQGGGVFANTSTTSVKEIDRNSSLSLRVEQNYPNPFSDVSNIRFTISKKALLSADLYSVIGVKIGNIAEGSYEAGSHILQISASELPAGKYFLRISNGIEAATKLISILK
ncbi:MAG: T9SS type A sorting domain-containing protein, partial [Ignavibacteriota bacterium]